MKKLLLIFVCVLLVGCGKEMVESVKIISAIEAEEMISQNNEIILLDVRSREEFNEIHIENAINMEYSQIESRFEKEITADKEKIIICYCKSGLRAEKAAEALMNLGYKNVYSMGGIDSWQGNVVK